MLRPIMCQSSRPQRHATRDAEQRHHQNWQKPPERHRRTDHAPPTLWHAAIAPADDRMHLRLGQAAWHNAQSKTSRHLPRCSRFHAQPDRLQPDPRSETRPCPPSKTTPNNRPRHQSHAHKRKTNAVPREFQFQGGGYRRCQVGRPPWCAPSGIDRRCSLRCRTVFFSRLLDKLMDCRRATNATAHVRPSARQWTAFLSWRWLDRATCLLKFTPKIAFSRHAWQ
jgi:hypothetical protein